MADQTALAPRTDESSSKVPARLGVVPTTVEEGWRLATMMAKSDLVPKAFRDRPADVMVAMQLGAELGFAPMQALQSIAVINGRPGVWGDGLLALVMVSPLYRDHDEYFEVDAQRRDGLTLEDLKKDTTAAVCSFVRNGKETPVTRRFTIAQAKKAQLLGKDGPWQTYPDRMLLMRARSFAARDTFPDLLRGLRTAEELRDIPADPPSPLREVLRASEAPRLTLADPTETLGPALVATVDREARAVILATGEQLAVDPADLDELAKFAGTTLPIRFTCTRRPAGLFVESFTIAD